MTFDTMLRLGRVSNLPTVWTNALAGAVLAGGAPASAIVTAALALSLFYIGGMWLNDAFDAQIDAAERANRPIPMGEAGRGTVYLVGYGLLAAGILVSFTLGAAAGATGGVLALAVVLYDWLHKKTPFAPVIMGITRFLSYALGAMAAGDFTDLATLGALGLMAYVVGLTYAARHEAYDRLDRAWPLWVLAAPVLLGAWFCLAAPIALPFLIALIALLAFALRFLFRRARGDVPKSVVTMIAGISLYDAVMLAGAGAPTLAVLAVLGFGLTLVLQRVAPGT